MIKASIDDAQLNAHINSLEQDGMTVFIMADGLFRGALFHGTRFVNQMRTNFKYGVLETLIMGQASLCGALMIPTMKGRERSVLRYDTAGPAAGFSVESDSAGYVRGYLLQNPVPVTKPLESWDLAPFFGDGTLTVSRFPEGKAEPQIGTVEIIHKNIARDLSWYFLQSEQIHTGFNTSIQFDKQGRVVGAGGLFLQVMPGADEELIERAENAFNACPSLGEWFSQKGNREDIIYGLFREFKPVEALKRDILFDCPCSAAKYRDYILRLDSNEIDDLLKTGDDPIEVVCHNCASVYHISKAEIESHRR